MLRTPAQIKPKSFESRRNFFAFFWTRGGCVSCLRACLGARLLPQSYPQYPNLSEGADCVGGQLRGDKEYPFSGVTKSGRVWRKVPESDARSVIKALLIIRKPLHKSNPCEREAIQVIYYSDLLWRQRRARRTDPRRNTRAWSRRSTCPAIRQWCSSSCVTL